LETVYYDFHIHSALSPCAANDMTPNNIVGMAVLNGLDVIAVTDHNTFGNVESVMKVAAKHNITVLPGAEIDTAEEVHVLCMFCDLETALAFENRLSPHYSDFPNRKDIFGDQLLFDENDNFVGEVDRMLLSATSISFDDLHALVSEFGGAFIPAHIDRSSYSVLSNLGFLPKYLNIPTVEVSNNGLKRNFLDKNNQIPPDTRIVTSSDAHYLWDIAEKGQLLSLCKYSPNGIIEFLSKK
jgi:PHP family Zn ribbon phosphoesterase